MDFESAGPRGLGDPGRVIRIVDPLQVAQDRLKHHLYHHPQKAHVIGDDGLEDLQVAEVAAQIAIAQALRVLAKAATEPPRLVPIKAEEHP